MQKRGLKVTDALKAVRLVRRVNPNKGFMQQLKNTDTDYFSLTDDTDAEEFEYSSSECD